MKRRTDPKQLARFAIGILICFSAWPRPLTRASSGEIGAEKCPDAAGRWIRNLITDYGAGGAAGGDISTALQKAVDEAGAAG
ncbi:MAG: hypothetical protein JWO87_3958, partial [Phycisphaerales bacterium]|nr:hypothetical protein [Phycisphaerales bacterium]